MRFNMYKHVGNTWLLGLLINYAVVIIYFLVVDRSPVDKETLWTIFLLIIVLFMLAIPSLFISLIFFRLILFSSIRKPSTALITWYWAIIISVFLEATFPLMLISRVVPELYVIALIGAGAGVTAAIVRWERFYLLFAALNHIKKERWQGEPLLSNSNC